MALANITTEISRVVPSESPLVLFHPKRSFDPKDLRALTRDFFGWFEYEWKQPVIRASLTECYDLLDQPSLRSLLDEEKVYTVLDLSAIWGHKLGTVKKAIRCSDICAVGKTRRRGNNGNGYNLYLGRDLVPIVERWEWRKFREIVDSLWSRFLAEPCGECTECLINPNRSQFYCLEIKRRPIKEYRDSLIDFLEAIKNYGDIETWWLHERDAIFARKLGAMNRYTGLILFYLLDRHLLKVPFDEFLRIPFQDIRDEDFSRPWRNRRPEEYETYLHGLEKTRYKEHIRHKSLFLLGKLVLLRNGYPGVAELGRPLTTEEVQKAAQEGRLLTKYITHGILLNFPLSSDIRVGHVVLDEVRFYFWNYAATDKQRQKKWYWSYGQQGVIQALEQILKTKIWFEDKQAILPSRPETEKDRMNPYILRSVAEQKGNCVTLLPQHVQDNIQSFIHYRYQHQRIELSTLRLSLQRIMPFLCWLEKQPDLKHYIHWDSNTTQHVISSFFSEESSSACLDTRNDAIFSIHVFFRTLAELGLPHAPGFGVIPTLYTRNKEKERSIPAEEVLDRMFHDGVCKLDYDPFARLALTIQYYCGTRITETLDLPLLCVLEDAKTESASLVIPLGKTKQERQFPIVSVGMGLLLQFMDQVFEMQTYPPTNEMPTRTPRNTSRMNVRYLEKDSEKAYQWYYLFDRRAYSVDQGIDNMDVLRVSRVCQALKEALLLAARENPQGLFQEGTYSPQCGRQRRKGQECGYFSFHDGIAICPFCGGPLPGTRGSRCHRIVTEKIECNGVAQGGSYFCPKCDAPLAELVKITPHTFRHNSVTRAHRYGVSLEQNMRLHGHETIFMHIRYLHLVPKDLQEAVCNVFSEKLLRHLHLEALYAPGQVIEEGVAHTITVDRALVSTLYRGQKRRTTGVWGAFWAGALAEQGVVSPTQLQAEMIITEETYHFAVAQYRYEALGLAVSEVALERGTKRKFKAEVAPFLMRQEIEKLVVGYLEHVQQGYLTTKLGVRLLEADIQAQRVFLGELADMLRPWWQHVGSIDQLVVELFPGIDHFQQQGVCDEFDQE